MVVFHHFVIVSVLPPEMLSSVSHTEYDLLLKFGYSVYAQGYENMQATFRIEIEAKIIKLNANK